jgi:molybdenum cofactor synthesis domain-containing protein
VGERRAKTSPVEIMSIGEELLLGRIQDTNSFWLARRIAELGGTVQRITVIGDDQPTIVRALREALGRGAGTIVTTGGLGPTPDDLTVASVAELLGVGVREDEAALADYCHRRETTVEQLSPALRRMATVPEGCEALLNPAGWAPAIRARVQDATIFVLPGPPREVEALFDRYLADYFRDTAECTRARRVYVGMWEAEVSPLLQEVMARVPGVYLKGYVAQGEQRWLPVEVIARGADEASAQRALDDAVELLRDLVRAADRAFQA